MSENGRRLVLSIGTPRKILRLFLVEGLVVGLRGHQNTKEISESLNSISEYGLSFGTCDAEYEAISSDGSFWSLRRSTAAREALAVLVDTVFPARAWWRAFSTS